MSDESRADFEMLLDAYAHEVRHGTRQADENSARAAIVVAWSRAQGPAEKCPDCDGTRVVQVPDDSRPTGERNEHCPRCVK